MYQLPQFVVVPAVAVEFRGVRSITLRSIVYLVAAQLAVLALIADPAVGVWERMGVEGHHPVLRIRAVFAEVHGVVDQPVDLLLRLHAADVCVHHLPIVDVGLAAVGLHGLL